MDTIWYWHPIEAMVRPYLPIRWRGLRDYINTKPMNDRQMCGVGRHDDLHQGNFFFFFISKNEVKTLGEHKFLLQLDFCRFLRLFTSNFFFNQLKCHGANEFL